MGMRVRVTVLSALALGASAGLVSAPIASATCNDSSGTVVCAQGDIRGTHGSPPSRGELGSWGTFCSSIACFTNGGYGFGLGS
jgi:hypothetical protein